MTKKQTKRTTTTKKKKTPPLKNATPIPPHKEMMFELQGKAYIVETEDGKEVTREELDGKIVLECVLHCLKYGINQLEEGK